MMGRGFVLSGFYTVVALVLLLCSAVAADPVEKREENHPPHAENFSGGVAAQNSYASWSGIAWAPLGHLHEDGLRLRAQIAYGRYAYDAGTFRNFAEPLSVELTPGLQMRLGPVISKFYAGLHWEKHWLTYPDAGNASAKEGYGIKLLSENWLDLPHGGFVSLDAGYSTRHFTYHLGGRLAPLRLFGWLQLGPEAFLNGNDDHRQHRLGGFVRIHYGRNMFDLNAGASYGETGQGAPYLGLSLLRKF